MKPEAAPGHAVTRAPVEIEIDVPHEDDGLSDETRQDLAELPGDPAAPVDAEQDVAPSGYDAESDLALRVREPDAGDVATPFAGSVVPAELGPLYDLERDAGR